MSTRIICYTRSGGSRPPGAVSIWYSELDQEDSGICDDGLRHQFDYPEDVTKIWVEITDVDPEDEEAMEIFHVDNWSFRCYDRRGVNEVYTHNLYKPLYRHVKSVIKNMEENGWMRVWY